MGKLNFKLLIQVIAGRDDGTMDYNYDIPKRMGAIFAEKVTVKSDQSNIQANFRHTISPVQISGIDEFPKW